MEQQTPYEKLAERMIAVAETGRFFDTRLTADGWYAQEMCESTLGMKVGPFATEFTAKVELAAALIEASI